MTTPSTPEPDPGPTLEPVDIEQPTFESFETPSFESISSGSFEPPPLPPPATEVQAESGVEVQAEADVEAEAESGVEAEAESPAAEPPGSEATSSLEVPGTFDEPDSASPAESPITAVPTFAVQSQSPTWASDAPSLSAIPAGFTAPHASPPPAVPPRDNRRLIVGLLSAVGALLLILVLILLYAFVFRDDPRTKVTSSASTATSAPSVESNSATESGAATETVAASTGDQVVDGPFTISVASTERGDTISSTVNQSLEKTAVGEFFVVYLNVGNTSADVQEFRSTLQTLNTDAGTIAPDDEASLYLGGGVVAISAGEVVETAVAFDVPIGTVASGVIVHGVPGMAGGELPLE